MSPRPRRPPPATEAIRGMRIEVLVRDYPETLALLDAAGIDVRARAPATLATAADGDALDALTRRVGERLAWRAEP